MSINHPVKTLFGRRQTRPLSPLARLLFETYMEKLTVTPEKLQDLMSNSPRLFLEVGFGSGEHLVQRALEDPNASFIGCEPFINGMSSLIQEIHKQNITNIFLYNQDARFLIDTMNDGVLDGCYILFPDPWPKKKHIQRRFVQIEMLKKIHRILKKDAFLLVATDHPVYQKWTQACLSSIDFFSLLCHDVERKPCGMPQTRYEQKAFKEGRLPQYFLYKKVLLS